MRALILWVKRALNCNCLLHHARLSSRKSTRASSCHAVSFWCVRNARIVDAWTKMFTGHESPGSAVFLTSTVVEFRVKDHATCHCLDVNQLRKYCIVQSSLLNVTARTDKDNKDRQQLENKKSTHPTSDRYPGQKKIYKYPKII